MTMAQFRKIKGQTVLDDPDAVAVAHVVEQHNRRLAKENCKISLDANADRVKHFVGRAQALRKTPAEVVIVLLNVDDNNGSALAEILMPGTDWQAYREQGQIPFARGLASREGIQEALDMLDAEAGQKLRKMRKLAVVVVDSDTADVFSAA